MASTFFARLVGGTVIAGMGAAAVGLLLAARYISATNRSAKSESEHAFRLDAGIAAKGENADSGTAVRLGRARLEAAGIEVEQVQSRPLEINLTCIGSADFDQNKYVAVPPRAEGILAKIDVDVGATVRAGDVLATVNSQTTGDLKASYIKALIHEQHLRWQVDKYKETVEGIATKYLFEAEHLLEEQLADTARFNSRLDSFGFSEDEIRQIAEKKDTSPRLAVVAPRAGVIVERHAVEGEPVQADEMLFAIADLDTMWVHLNAFEHQLPQVRLGQAVKFYPDGLPDLGFEGKVIWVSPAVDLKTRTIRLRAEVANRDHMLRANMFGKGELLVEPTRERIVVPLSAVQTHAGQHIVFVEKPDNLFEVRRVEIGLKHDQFWEVISGLQLGERVATTGSFLLKSNLENPEFGSVE